ncbi:hypothetical protein BOSE21B_111223 [Bosea sp. 21B]|nr:hypothetical protein BOSE21B_111223 [Bosea sp. 21B]CAD5272436.1 hypothetical protein BOSE7B_30173 [Bosea sp. 7B]VXC70523.1 hypothetical protein BOSE127_40170 [Bosea sp. 127]
MHPQRKTATLADRRFADLRPKLVRSRGLEPPRVSPLPPQGSASTNSAMTAAAPGGRRAVAVNSGAARV